MSDKPTPTCATCVYYQPYQGGGVLMQMVPPDDPTKLVHVTPRELRQDLHGLCRIRSQPTFPLRRCDDVCGEHPDFGAWLADRHDTPSRHEPDPERDEDGEECPPTPPPVPWPDHYRAISEERERALTAEAERDRFRAAQETDADEVIHLSGVIGRFRTVQIRAEAVVKRLDAAMRTSSSLSYPRDEPAAVVRDLVKIQTEK